MKSLPSRRTHLSLTCVAVAALLVAGCGKRKEEVAPIESDPAVSGSLGDEIVVDPSLSHADGRALEAGGAKAGLSAKDHSPEAIQAARDEAMVQAGGNLKSAPTPQTGSANPLAASVAAAARGAQAAGTDCTKKAQYAAAWSGKLPAELPVYPRGTIREAAGTDADGCHLRVVNFVSPVPAKDIIDFYYTRATAAGYGAEYRMDGADHVLGGRKAGKAYVVYARKLASGGSDVDLIASGS